LPTKYRRKVFSEEVTGNLLEVCKQIEEVYEIYFLEIGSEAEHVHFLIQGLPSMTITRIVTILKSKSSNYLFQKC
jgi:REP element-mobilizing transposase RayT